MGLLDRVKSGLQSYFEPDPDEVRIRDVFREVPGVFSDAQQASKQGAQSLFQDPLADRVGRWLSGTNDNKGALIAPVETPEQMAVLREQVQKEISTQERTSVQRGFGEFLAPYTLEQTKKELAGTPTGFGKIGVAGLAGLSLIPDVPNIGKLAKFGKATIADPDIFKKLVGDYDPANHTKYAEQAKEFWRTQLRTNQNSTAKILGGGSGSGKSEFLIPRAASNYDGVIYDGTLSNYKEATARIGEATQAGKKTEVNYILPDIDRAWKYAQIRAIEAGREVPLNVFIDKHVNSVETLKRLISENPNLRTRLLDTRGITTKTGVNAQKFINDSEEILDRLNKIDYDKTKLLNQLENVRPSNKQIEEARQVAARGLPSGGVRAGDITDESRIAGQSARAFRLGAEDGLTQQARKFKSADELYDSLPTRFHGTNVEFDKLKSARQLTKEGVEVSSTNIGGAISPFVHITENPQLSKLYASARARNLGGKPITKEVKVIGKLKDLIDDNSVSFSSVERMSDEAIEQLRKEGFVGIRFRDVGSAGRTVQTEAVFPDAIKTKSQVTDIWKKAQGLERGFITSAKRAVPEIKVSPQLRLAGKYIPRSTDELAIAAKNLIIDNIDQAERIAMSGTDDQAVALASELLKHYNTQAELATSRAAQLALYDKAAEIAATIAPKLTEQGRAIQAASILGRMTPEGQVRFAARSIDKYNIANPNKKIPQLTGKQTEDIAKEMKAINEMADGEAKAIRFKKLQDEMANLIPTPLFKKVIAVWKAGLLTGMKTQGLNIFANLAHQGTEVISNIPGALVDQIVALGTGKRALSVGVKGTGRGSSEGMRKAMRYLRTGFDERDIGTKLDYKRVNFGSGTLAKGLQAYTDSVFRVLGAEDQAFYYASKLRSMYEQGKVGAINKGLRGRKAQRFIDDLVQNPTDEMVRYAALDAETAVFQNRTALGAAARKIQQIGGGAGELVLPFGRTPSAVAMQIVNYSPVGIAKTIIQNIGKGKFDQRLFSQGVGRGLTGTAAVGIGAYLYKQGKLTLDRPTSERERELWKSEGRQANSIKVGDKWRRVPILGPVGNVLLIGGHTQKNFEEEGSFSAAFANTMAGATKSFTEQTFLTGINNFVSAITDPQRSGEFVLGSQVSSFVPTLIADIARSTDKYERRTETIRDRIFTRIPGLRQGLEPQVSALGEKRETVGNPLELMIDPSRPSPIELDNPVVDELRRLWDADVKVSPTLLGDREGYKALTSEQNTDLWVRAGTIIQGKIGNLINTPEYQAADDEKKGKAIEKFVTKSKNVARAEKVMELTEGLKGEELRAELKRLKDETKLFNQSVFKEYEKLVDLNL